MMKSKFILNSLVPFGISLAISIFLFSLDSKNNIQFYFVYKILKNSRLGYHKGHLKLTSASQPPRSSSLGCRELTTQVGLPVWYRSLLGCARPHGKQALKSHSFTLSFPNIIPFNNLIRFFMLK